MSADGKSRDIEQIVAERLARPRSYRVILRACDTPDPDKIAGIVSESLQDLGVAPRGKVLIKPNVVTANRAYIHNSYTHPSVVEAMVRVLRESAPEKITIGESGGFGGNLRHVRLPPRGRRHRLRGGGGDHGPGGDFRDGGSG